MYGSVISAITAMYWRDSPVGVAAIAVLCAGDGFADIVGRKFGKGNKLPHSPCKVSILALAFAAKAVCHEGYDSPCLKVGHGWSSVVTGLAARLDKVLTL